MAGEVTFVTRELVEDYVQGKLGHEEAEAVENVIETDERAKGIAEKARRKLRKGVSSTIVTANNGDNDE